MSKNQGMQNIIWLIATLQLNPSSLTAEIGTF